MASSTQLALQSGVAGLEPRSKTLFATLILAAERLGLVPTAPAAAAAVLVGSVASHRLSVLAGTESGCSRVVFLPVECDPEMQQQPGRRTAGHRNDVAAVLAAATAAYAGDRRALPSVVCAVVSRL